MTIEQIVDKMVEEVNIADEDGGIELYRDYSDEFPVDKMRKIMESDYPRFEYEDTLQEWANEHADYYTQEAWDDSLAEELMDEDMDIDEIRDEFLCRFYGTYDERDWNDRFHVNVIIDTGNANYDFTRDNVLNYCGNGFIDSNSSILWLARQFRKENDLRKAVGRYMKGKKVGKDKFIRSCLQEYANLPSHMGTLTFLLDMSVSELIKVREAQVNKSKGYIEVGKNCMCGLFNDWDGAGSVLEIELDHSIKIPIDMIHKIQFEGSREEYHYTVDEVYGLIGSCWKEPLGVHVKGERK